MNQDEASLKSTETSNSQTLAGAQAAVNQDEASLKSTEERATPRPSPGPRRR